MRSLDGGERLGDGSDCGPGFDGRGTGDVGYQRLAVLFRSAQIGVGLDERFLFHGVHDSNSVRSFNRFEWAVNMRNAT